ncbi:MAG: hypothetical protein KAJ17_03975, partial [Candidatus Krumholzibacteria bacterium]|nr:hypothetical protein [Candidatus Krumholzibacteria bacterium]
VIAAALNFCTLCVINQHLFSLPFENLEAIKYSEDLIKNIKRHSDTMTSDRSSGRTAEKSPKTESSAFEAEPMIESATRSDASDEDAAIERQPSF